MSIDLEIPTHLNIRIDPKLRYFIELAARAKRKDVSLTDYIESALWESLKTVSIDPLPGFDEEPEVRELSPAERLEKLKRREKTISNPLFEVTDQLWSEYPLKRLELLATYAEHLMSEEDRTIWKSLFTRKELKTKEGKLNHKQIHIDWVHIKKAALAESKAKAKGK
jgi:hypothetical protein